jgi:hypothetical protein
MATLPTRKLKQSLGPSKNRHPKPLLHSSNKKAKHSTDSGYNHQEMIEILPYLFPQLDLLHQKRQKIVKKV